MLQAVIFDLDGVLCSTDEYHFRAWSRLACKLHLPFDREKNRRLRGIGRMDALDILLEDSGVAYTAEQKSVLARQKNDYYVEQLHRLTPADVFPGVTETLQTLRERNNGCRKKNERSFYPSCGRFAYLGSHGCVLLKRTRQLQNQKLSRFKCDWQFARSSSFAKTK